MRSSLRKPTRAQAVVVVVLAITAIVITALLVPPLRHVVTPIKLGITLANFNRIETGMTREEVERILGFGGGEVSHVAIDGPPTTSYIWLKLRGMPCSAPPPCMQQITVSFSGERVVGKSQSGLVS